MIVDSNARFPKSHMRQLCNATFPYILSIQQQRRRLLPIQFIWHLACDGRLQETVRIFVRRQVGVKRQPLARGRIVRVVVRPAAVHAGVKAVFERLRNVRR